MNHCTATSWLQGGFEAATQQPLVTPNSDTSALELSSLVTARRLPAEQLINALYIITLYK